ncbi:alpha/beta hydrolase [Nguyenibacter vanlangensis]|uniref:Alpha/beta hydrolase n=1 Tax=Nguyenibacter vanlangensis TaxID=1216886 RepID=A0ABZ3D1L6_9PROT
MTNLDHPNFTRIRHPISAVERELEKGVVAKIVDHFHTSSGTPRETYAAMHDWTPIADGVVTEPVEQDSVSGVWVRPANALANRAILLIHGGVYILGSAQAYRGLASQLAVRAGVAVFVLDYPLAPEHPFPAAPNAAAAALRWLAAQGVAEVALAGDSAGGALILAALALCGPGAPKVASVVAFSPWLDLAFTGPSFTDPQTHDPVLTREILRGGAGAYLAGAVPTDGRASPLYEIPQNLPPILIQVGEDELLLDDSRRYAEVAAMRGGEVQLDVFEGLHHVFQSSVSALPSARRALDDTASFIATHWS